MRQQLVRMPFICAPQYFFFRIQLFRFLIDIHIMYLRTWDHIINQFIASFFIAGPEIINDIKAAGAKLDYWVTGYGTGGTYHGAGKYIKATSPDTKIVLAEPGAAALIDSGIKTERNADGSPKGTHPAFSAHPIQGWTPDFIPLVLEQGMSLDLMDDYVQIPDGAAVETSQALAQKEGILTGISGGATMYAAIETAKSAPKGSVIVAMLPDTGERYLSTPLFASIDAEMNDAELEIARSTPSWILEPST